MFILFQPECCDHREENGLSGFGFRSEDSDLIAQVFRVRFGDGERIDGVFDLAQVDHLVSSVDGQINLSAFFGSSALPGRGMANDAADTQRFFDLRDMSQAYLLKGIARPGPLRGVIDSVHPHPFVVVGVVFYELQVEQAVEIGQAVKSVLRFFVKGRIAGDEPTLLQFPQQAGQGSAGFHTGRLRQLFAGHPPCLSGQGGDDGFVFLSVPE